MVIDCHQHLSLINEKSFKKASQKLISEMHKNQISKVIVIADNVSNSNCADLNILLNCFKNNKNVYLVGAINPFRSLKTNIEKLNKLLAERKIIGLKIYSGHDKIFPTDKRFNSTYQLCLKYNKPVIIHTGQNIQDKNCAKYNDPKFIIKIAKIYPQLKIIIAHYFWPKLDYCYQITKDYQNIYYDISGLADKEVIKRSGGLYKIKKVLIETIIKKPANVLFGTDYPICSIKNHLKLIKSLKIQKSLKNKIFHENTIRVFNI